MCIRNFPTHYKGAHENSQGLHFLQGTYPCEIMLSLLSELSCLFVVGRELQVGLWNFFVLVFST